MCTMSREEVGHIWREQEAEQSKTATEGGIHALKRAVCTNPTAWRTTLQKFMRLASHIRSGRR
jgi:hypothetical protein